MDLQCYRSAQIKHTSWLPLSPEFGDKYIDDHLWNEVSHLKYKHDGSEIVLNRYTVGRYSPQGELRDSLTYTRIRVPFINKHSLRFKIYPANFLNSVEKLFMMQDIEVGDVAFDKKFIIKCNEEHKIKLLFNDRKLKDLLYEQPEFLFFEMRGKTIDALHFECSGNIRKISQLKALFEMFAITLTRMGQLELTSRNVSSEELKQISSDTDAPENTKPDKTGINLDELRQGVKELKSNSKIDDLQ